MAALRKQKTKTNSGVTTRRKLLCQTISELRAIVPKKTFLSLWIAKGNSRKSGNSQPNS